MIAHVYSDGSCIQGHRGGTVPGMPEPSHAGGWAAVVIHEPHGWLLTGQAQRTTAVRMELKAMVEGLHSLPDEVKVCLHTDSTVALVIQDRWERNELAAKVSRRDADLWRELAAEYERLSVTIELVGKGGDRMHKWAHVAASSCARSADREHVASEVLHAKRRRRVSLAGHHRDCTPQACALSCAIGGWMPSVVRGC